MLYFCCCLQFLDQCTILLDLPFAARRLFDENGVEHFNLTTLRRDQLVYVTCGEPWSDPKLSKSEQQRHFLLSNLAADVAKIQHYIQLSKAKSKCDFSPESFWRYRCCIMLVTDVPWVISLSNFRRRIVLCIVWLYLPIEVKYWSEILVNMTSLQIWFGKFGISSFWSLKMINYQCRCELWRW